MALCHASRRDRVLAVSLFFMARIPGSFMPPEDASRIVLSVELPPNAQLSDTEEITDLIAERIAGYEGVEDVTVLGGSSPLGKLEYRRASITVTLGKLAHSLPEALVNDILGGLPVIGSYLPKIPPSGRTVPQWKIEQDILAGMADIPDVRITKLNDRGQRDIEFNFLSDNEQDLQNAVAILEAKLRNEPMLDKVSSEGALPRPELKIRPKKEIAARLGITPAQISETVRVATVGDVDANLAKISLDNRLIPVRVRSDLELRRDLAAIRALKIKTASGQMVPLSVVANVDYSEGVSTVERSDRHRVVSIGANLPPGVALDPATARFRAIVESTDLPDTVTLAESGDAKILAEMQQSFVNAMLLGLFLVLAVLILLFKDVIQPFTILFSLPLALGGVAIALIITDNPISMPVLIGLLMLMGIVTKNAILLVDFGQGGDLARTGAPAGAGGGGAQARTPDHHDLDRDVGRHASGGARRWRGVILPRTDGGCGDRRHHHVHGPVASRGAGLLHDHGRSGAAACMGLQPLHRQGRSGR